MAKRHYTRRKRYPIFGRSLALVALGALLAVLLWANSVTTNPTAALAQALESLENERYDEARSYLGVPLKDERLQQWARLFRGQLFERQGEARRAAEDFIEVSPVSAASLDARLGLARVQTLLSSADRSDLGLGELKGETLSALEADIRSANRDDLLPEALLLEAQRAEDSGEIAQAAVLYQNIRRTFPRAAKQARTAYSRLFANNEQLLAAQPVAALVEDAKLLLAEQEPLLALERTQLARSKTTEGSSACFEALFVEEQVLRKLKRNEEADHLLLLMGADAAEEIGDAALLKIAKNAWNINDHHRALEFIDKLKTRFPSSGLLDEARYVEGRVLEEMTLLPEARDLYLKLAETGVDALMRLRALRRVAWLYLGSEDYENAALLFSRAQLEARGVLEELRRLIDSQSAGGAELGPKLGEVQDERAHSAYWGAYALSKIEPIAREKLAVEEKNPLALWTETAREGGYYAALSRRAAGLPQPPAPADSGSCRTPVDPTLHDTLAPLVHPRLRRLARAEIDWHFARALNLPFSAAEPTAGAGGLLPSITRAELYLRYGSPELAIALSETVVQQLQLATDPPPGCQAAAEALRYPLPYREVFEDASLKHGVELALLLAIARTESHFDAQAVSTAGALGLMQLLPPTAQEEGWDEKTSLFDPQANILLGAKHLKRLLSQQTEIPYVTAAYNAGSSAVTRWRSRFSDLPLDMWIERIGYPETLKYVKRVTMALDEYRARLPR